MTTKVTKKQAQAIEKLVCKKYGYKVGDQGAPKLVMDFDWLGHGGKPHIVWEEGPYEWAIDFTTDEVEVFLEPMTNWALGIYQI